ncbi:MAG: 1-deoxy-D-xylulose-5-phosphate reductoisomerase [Elusimicrobia bacterium]|nr:MAG: 1-deoxy-D-xylulose-5-phosphate reductoisomerase [Elusimicrobiota bacterium]
MKKIAILGSTGSIGVNTLNVVRKLGKGYKITGISAQKNVNLLIKQIIEFRPTIVALGDEGAAQELKKRLRRFRPLPRIYEGTSGLIEFARNPVSDFLVSALVGAAGLLPTLAAIEAGKDIALANKEILVMAGDLIIKTAEKRRIKILPLDSEHSAIFQCLRAEKIKNVRRLILTASGGPFYKYKKSQLEKVTVKETLHHPTWQMGKKITVDSATLMNKGLEAIEASHLFGIDINRIDVLIHPQTTVHSLVELVDGSILAQLAIADMRIPIQFALTYPQRYPSRLQGLKLEKIAHLTFQKPNLKNFPCLGLALKAGRIGGTMPVVLNAADEIAVEAFLVGKIKLTDIPKIIESVMAEHKVNKKPSLKKILETDHWTRNRTREKIKCS